MLAGWLCIGVGAALMPGVSGLCGCRDRVNVVIGLMSGPNNGVETEFYRRNRVLVSGSSLMPRPSWCELSLGPLVNRDSTCWRALAIQSLPIKAWRVFTIICLTLAQSDSPSTLSLTDLDNSSAK